MDSLFICFGWVKVHGAGIPLGCELCPLYMYDNDILIAEWETKARKRIKVRISSHKVVLSMYDRFT